MRRSLLLAALAAAALAAAPRLARPQTEDVEIRITGRLNALRAPAKSVALKGDHQDLVFFAHDRPVLMRLHLFVNGKPLGAAWDDFLKKLFTHFDANGDGFLSASEVARLPRPDVLRQQLGVGGQVFAEVLLINGQPRRPQRPAALTVADLDCDKDGRVSLREMADYYGKAGLTPLRVQLDQQARSSDYLTNALFKHLDRNGDGKLSRAELARAAETLRKLDLDEDEMITVEELAPRNFGYGSQFVLVDYAIDGGGTPLPDGAAFRAVVPGEAPEPLARQILARYDRDRDQKLSRKEIALPAADFDALDADKDGFLDIKELAKWVAHPPDVEMAARFGDAAPVRGVIGLFPGVSFGTVGAKEASVDVTGPAAAKIRRDGNAQHTGADTLRLTVGDASIDLLRGSAAGGGFIVLGGGQRPLLDQFKELDKAKKGYVGKKDVEKPAYQGLRNLFDLADRDGDGKLTEKELRSYLDVLDAGPRVHLSVAVADLGRGLLECIDVNGDNRLSVRELRSAWDRLARWDRDGDGCISKNEVPRQFRLTVSQGRANLGYRVLSVGGGMGVSSRFAPPNRGPAWFRKMDRNGDGDLSRDEWLGTEEEFRKIDADGDGLISRQEAERYDARMKQQK